jgi:hypothetical protein
VEPLRENVELKAQKLRSSRVILGQSSSQRGDEGKKQQGMVPNILSPLTL